MNATLTMKLNINASRLLNEYGITMKAVGVSTGGDHVPPRAADSVTMCDGRVDVFDSGGGVINTVTIDTDRHAEV